MSGAALAGHPRMRLAAALGAAAAAGVPLYWLRLDLAPVTGLTAEAARLALCALGVACERFGQVLQIGSFRAEIGIECTALLPALALWAGLWAVAPALRHPWRAAAWGTGVLFALNTARIAHLGVIGAYAPELLWLWHVVIWQAVVIAAPAALFAFAVRRERR